jgi:hypothetical protein
MTHTCHMDPFDYIRHSQTCLMTETDLIYKTLFFL